MPNPIYSKQEKETIAMFREMRRKNQQMSDEEARDILAAATSQYRSVIAFGRLRVLKSDEEKRETAEFLGEAYYPGHPEACDEEIKKHWPAFNMVELKIEHLTGKKGKDLVE